ncbi:MAG: PmoA family protein [Planctomycetales bacterium]|nr:PmoA family protein [Planctomycetales bacterium]MCA9166864.1 PmoA family protein [Planctomycetales bacterium]
MIKHRTWISQLGRVACGLFCLLNFTLRSGAAELPIQITPAEGKFVVDAGGQPFCEIDYKTYAKPIVYPIYGPGQVPMTRNNPMKEVDGESNDHPHHKSMWVAHGDVNGVSFWDEKGKILNEKAELVELGNGQQAIQLQDKLIDPQGNVVCTETVTYVFSANEQARSIDWQVTYHAGEQPLVFGDTKEGMAALRVHPNLRLSNDAKRGVTTAAGHSTNSEGVENAAVWGKRAKWVNYDGTINDQPVGIAFFDNPQNHGHPTYWHARDYGLFAANPFGASQFAGNGANGQHEVAAGQDFTMKYRVIFHRGNAEQYGVAAKYAEYEAAAKTE